MMPKLVCSVVNLCSWFSTTSATVAVNEAWSLIYDAVTGTWVVEGSRSDEQVNAAVSDQRYVSDHGEVSFTILEGELPPTSGDAFTFQVDDGVLRIDDLPDSSGSSQALRQPAIPVLFGARSGPTGGGWDALDYRVYALVPLTNLDSVMRVRLNTWDVDIVWN